MLIMIRLALSEEEMVDIAEALDDPMLPENRKRSYWCRMHNEGAKTGFIAKVLAFIVTITNHLKEYRDGGLAEFEDRLSRVVRLLLLYHA